ncbi:MAG TPA: nitroreductase [Firmicutes bacterium]|nr:nitroreductase [Bacillota bacterium]
MEIPVQRWYEAIYQRKSVRNYTVQTPSAEALQGLQEVADQMRDACPAARAVVVHDAPKAMFKGILGSYGGVQGAPACVLFIADTEHRHHQMQLGYLGEAVILEATALGLGTCWIGGFFSANLAKQLTPIRPEERIIAVTPLGYPAIVRWDEKLLKSAARSNTRKPLAEICQPEPEQWPDWGRSGLAAARTAPSALNRQPWRFTLQDGTVSIAPNKALETGVLTRRLDCGIAMLHFQVGAAHAGAYGTWVWEDEGPAIGTFQLHSPPPRP